MRQIDIQTVQQMQLELMKKLHAFLDSNNIKYYLIAGSALGAVRHGGFIPWDDDIDIGMFREEYEKFLAVASSFDSQYDIVNFNNARNCDFGLTRIYFKNTYVEDESISRTKLDKRLYFDVFPLDNVPDDAEELRAFEQKIVKAKKMLSRVDVRDYGNSKGVLAAKYAVSMILSPFRRNVLSHFDKLMKTYKNQDTQAVCSLCSQYSFKKQVMQKSTYGEPTLHVFENVEFYIPEKIELYLTTLYGGNYMEIPPVEKRRKPHNIYVTNEDSNVSNID